MKIKNIRFQGDKAISFCLYLKFLLEFVGVYRICSNTLRLNIQIGIKSWDFTSTSDWVVFKENIRGCLETFGAIVLFISKPRAYKSEEQDDSDKEKSNNLTSHSLYNANW